MLTMELKKKTNDSIIQRDRWKHRNPLMKSLYADAIVSEAEKYSQLNC